MELIHWTDAMKVNVAALDEDHKKLFTMINELHAAIMAGHKREVLESVLDGLIEYSKVHLAREEDLMEKAAYPERFDHKREHDRMIRRAENMKARLSAGSTAMLSLELKSFLENWWTIHIQGSDKKYTLHLNRRGIY
ncbi:MAG TPA: bacteriohemerythrin [Terracidiphilus sp.]|nr:bacteriohemerythrin [Terracidiphilus sp.]